MCGGPSAQQQAIEAQQQQFFSTLQSGYQTMFAGQTSILNSLKSSFAPILAAGINQYGFSPQEDAALRTQATAGVARNYQAAQQATGNAMAAEGGGNTFLPQGAATELAQQNALAATQTQSSEQLGITAAGYQQGEQNYMAAANELGGVAQTMNPLGYAGQVTGAGSASYGEAQQNATQSSQELSSIFGAVGGMGAAGISMGMKK